jgi:hypothetical protein
LSGGTVSGNVIGLSSEAAGQGSTLDLTSGSDQKPASSAGTLQLQALDSRALDQIDLSTLAAQALRPAAGPQDLDAVADDLVSSVGADASHTDAALAS